MRDSTTEIRHHGAEGLDMRDPAEAAALLAKVQCDAAQAVTKAADALSRASELMAAALSTGGRLIYAGAGSSGLMAMADALELPGTYGIAEDRVLFLLAGGADSLFGLPGHFEDDRDAARADLARVHPTPADCVLVASASGATPYALQIAEDAARGGATVIAMANNADAPLFAPATLSILLETPPEPIAGSTRMGAGTAQKIAFNILSTLMAIRLGHVHDGYMVNLRADNAKLAGRAARIVAAIAGTDAADAGKWLDKAGGSVKPAVLMAKGAASRDEAERLLAIHGENLRGALEHLVRQ